MVDFYWPTRLLILRFLSFRTRIILFCTILLVLVQGIAFLLVNNYNTIVAERAENQQLETAKRVFLNVLDENIAKFTNTATVIASDFGLRSAIATRDLATIRSALRNHSARIGADIAMVFGLENQCLVDTNDLDVKQTTKSLVNLMDIADTQGKASGLVVIDNNAYQVTVTPVMAPDLIAWVVLGFAIDDKLANFLLGLTGVHISFFSIDNGNLTLNSSTLSQADRSILYNKLLNNDASSESDSLVSPLMEGYVSRIIKLTNTGTSHIIAILQKPNRESLQHLKQLKQLLIWLLLGSILASMIGAFLIAQRVAKPLNMLADVAIKINTGDYSQAANIAERDEIGLLAESFNQMRDSITVLLRLAYRDVLTNLPNRAMFGDRLEQAYKLAKRSNNHFTLIMIDLDLFKIINDTYGHDAGDLVIKTIGDRLKSVLRESDTIARLGGDEFAMILMTNNPQIIKAVTNKIIDAIAQPISYDKYNLSVGCSIGAAIYPQHGDDTVTLMRHADIAMYEAKRNKVDMVVIYKPEYELSLDSAKNTGLELDNTTKNADSRCF
jgi:diguanylate cyclase (GGDEF)-like protein